MFTIEGDTFSRMLRTTYPVAFRGGGPLCNVFIRVAGAELHVVATDGHRLHWAKARQLGDLSDASITYAAAEEIAKPLRGEERLFRVASVGGKLEVRNDVTDDLVVTADLTHEKRPNIQHAVPQYADTKGAGAIGVNPEYLVDSLSVIKYATRPIPRKLLKKGEKQNFAAARLQLGVSDLDAIRIDAQGFGLLFDLTCVIAPMRA